MTHKEIHEKDGRYWTPFFPLSMRTKLRDESEWAKAKTLRNVRVLLHLVGRESFNGKRVIWVKRS